MIRVLITGVGSVIGQGVIKSLKNSSKSVFIVGCDSRSKTVGQVWSDKFIECPLVTSSKYKEWFMQTLKSEKIDLVFTGLEQDLEFILKNLQEINLFTSTVFNNSHLVALTRDKWLFQQKLIELCPKFAIPSSIKNNYQEIVNLLGSNLILKPRIGHSSRGILRINSENEFSLNANIIGVDYLVQKVVGNENTEFTSSVFGDGSGRILAMIHLHRYLSNTGATEMATPVDHAGLDAACQELAKVFKPVGPTNLQFRIEEENIYLLEINPRISSSTSIRMLNNFNESEMALNYYLNLGEVAQPDILNKSVIRYWEDYVS